MHEEHANEEGLPPKIPARFTEAHDRLNDPEFKLAMVTHGIRNPERREAALIQYCRFLAQPRTCDSCKYWEAYSPSQGDCHHGSNFSWPTESDPACMKPVSNYDKPRLVTGPKFGCIHHESQP